MRLERIANMGLLVIMVISTIQVMGVFKAMLWLSTLH